MNKQNFKKEKTDKPKGSGPPLSRLGGSTRPVIRAAVLPSSTSVTTKAMAEPRPSSASAGIGAEEKALPPLCTMAPSEAPVTSENVVRQLSTACDGETKESAVASTSGSKWPKITLSDPAKAGYQERRTASRLLKKVHQNGPTEEELTKELQDAIDWAKAILPDFQPDHVRVAPLKRQRSAEESKSLAKKMKTQGVTLRKSFAEVAKDRMVIGVLDEGNPEGKIPRSQWKWVQAALANVFLKVMANNPGSPPRCEDMGWYQGQVKIIACGDNRSVELYKAAISEVGEVYPGAKLKVVDKDHIPSRPRARVWIPSTPNEPAEIMKIFQASNPELPINEWKFIKIEGAEDDVETKRATMQVLLLLTKDSLEPLAKVDGVVNYGFGRVKVKTYKTDTEAADFLALAAESEIAGETHNELDAMSEADSERSEGCKSVSSEICRTLGKLYTETELLSEPQKDVEITATNVTSSSNKPPSL